MENQSKLLLVETQFAFKFCKCHFILCKLCYYLANRLQVTLHNCIHSTCRDLHSREYLDECLSRALNLPLEKQEDGQERLPLIDESGYVLTLDYTIKMLSIHERRECRMPVIIEGETGVGKSALVEMLSKLWNASWTNVQRKNKEHILTFLRKILQGWLPVVKIMF